MCDLAATFPQLQFNCDHTSNVGCSTLRVSEAANYIMETQHCLSLIQLAAEVKRGIFKELLRIFYMPLRFKKVTDLNLEDSFGI